jgi:hypothetical protein
MSLPAALVTIRRYLRQKNLDRFEVLVETLNDGVNPFEEKVEWNSVFFVSKHIGESGSLLRAVNNLTLKPQDQCSIQVVVAVDAGQAEAGLQYCEPRIPVLVIAFAQTFADTKNIKDYISSQKVMNNPIRFDFVNPDLHRLKLLQEVDLTAALFERVKEGVLAFQMDVENYATTVNISDFQAALQIAANELDISKLA